jgi:hypothetical protein
MKEVKSTLDGFEINYERCSGNSTREIGVAINYLFNGYKVKVKDHFKDGESEVSNRYLFKRILKRLRSEHPEQKVIIDSYNFTIEFI